MTRRVAAVQPPLAACSKVADVRRTDSHYRREWPTGTAGHEGFQHLAGSAMMSSHRSIYLHL